MYYVRGIYSGCKPAKISDQEISDSHLKIDTMKYFNFDLKMSRLANKFVLTPNPSNEKVILLSPEQIISMQIYNSSGVLIKTIKGNKLTSIPINTSDFRSGYYTISILTNRRKETLKLLVQH
jgi:hypothetical protein